MQLSTSCGAGVARLRARTVTNDATPQRARLAVLGSPIAHSLSPRLHAAAYGVLGLPWSYGAADVTAAALTEFLEGCDGSWRGLSLTMPLKRDVVPLLDSLDPVAAQTGVANTVLFAEGALKGYNTDVAGIVRPLREAGVQSLDQVVIFGGGATATSALVAVAELGASSALFWVRTPAKATGLQHLGSELGVEVEARSFTDLGRGVGRPDAVISTLPNGTMVNLVVPEEARRSSILFDVAYDPWPTALADAWGAVSAPVISGLEMLLAQALVQVRIFVNGDPESELPDEEGVMNAMRASVEGSSQA
jgi:shikimate dehydrogenase